MEVARRKPIFLLEAIKGCCIEEVAQKLPVERMQ